MYVYMYVFTLIKTTCISQFVVYLNSIYLVSVVASCEKTLIRRKQNSLNCNCFYFCIKFTLRIFQVLLVVMIYRL